MKERITAIILAAGQGKRMNSRIQKQFMLLQEKPLLYYSLRCFQDSEIEEIVLVTGSGEIEFCQKAIVEAYGFTKVKAVIAGGAERYDSVEKGLACIEDGIVLIHDGARPFVSREMIRQSIIAAMENGACTVGVPVKDTIKVVDEAQYGIETPDRKTLWQVQTPQAFRTGLIKEAYVRMRQDGMENITDDTMLVERYCGVRSKIIMGDYHNLKITTPEDFIAAEAFLRYDLQSKESIL